MNMNTLQMASVLPTRSQAAVSPKAGGPRPAPRTAHVAAGYKQLSPSPLNSRPSFPSALTTSTSFFRHLNPT